MGWEKKHSPEYAVSDDQVARYFAMVSVDTEMRLCACEGLHRSVRRVSQSCAKKLCSLSVVGLVKVPP